MSDGVSPVLAIRRDELGRNSTIRVTIGDDSDDLAHRMAADMADVIRRQNQRGQPTRLIVPVGPVGQYPHLAELVNRERLSLAHVWFFNMDEYLTDSDEWVALDHPLSFRAFMDRRFFSMLDPCLAPPAAQRIFPDPHRPRAVTELIDRIGGIDVCFGGVGINGHIAFNEPPESGQSIALDAFADLPTRLIALSRETRTINSVTSGGDISEIPKRAVTIGMREILAARAVRLYCNRPWQSGIVRRILHGPVTPAVPASLLQNHPDVVMTLADVVADAPEFGLR